MRTAWLWVLTAALLAPQAGAVEGVKKERAPEEKAERAKDRPAARLAEEFGVGETQVKELRDKGLGWGEVRHALSLSQRSGRPVDDVMKLRDEGLGWGQIAQKYGLKLGEGKPAKQPEAGEGEPVRDAVREKERGKEREVRGKEGRGKEGRGREGRGGPRK